MREFSDLPPEFDDAAAIAPDQDALPELRRYLAEVKGQAQFLLYLADQIEESLEQLTQETRSLPQRLPLQDPGHVLQPAREQAPGPGREDRRGLPGGLRDRPRARAVDSLITTSSRRPR